MRKCTPVFGKIAYITHEFGYDDISKEMKMKGETKKKYVNHINHIEAPTIERIREMAKESFSEDFKNLEYEKKEIEIVLSDGRVMIYKEREYSNDYGIESSKTYKTWIEVKAVRNNEIVRTLRIKEKTVLNPKYEDRPECDFCYKQVVAVFDDNLLDENKKPVKVCKKCKAELKIMRGIVIQIKKEKEQKAEIDEK